MKPKALLETAKVSIQPYLTEETVQRISLWIIVTCLMILLAKVQLQNAATLALLVIQIIYAVPGRINFGVALGLLILTMSAVLVRQDTWAESLAVLVYYQLCLGVLMDLVNITLREYMQNPQITNTNK
jgi:hypothetical protein